jgi:hypothetical protein
MKPASLLLAITLCSSANISSFGQEKNEASNNLQKPNIFKVNLTGIVLKNYSFQYERILNKKIAVALSFRTMPESSVPLKNLILDAADDDEQTKEVLDALRISNTAITPEVRFYLGKKGFGKGFYIAPFYRYASFKTNNMKFTYTNSLGGNNDILLSGKLTSHTGGIMFGSQWNLGKHFCLDFWILGPHYGSGNGFFEGKTTVPLNTFEQNSLRQELEDFDLPLTKESSTVNANGATLTLDGPWGGIRSGLSLGIRF